MDVELIQMAGPLPIAALASGEIDYLTGYTTGIVATGQGAPLKGIMISLRKPPFYLIAEPNIQRPADLAGKRIGVDRIGSLQHLVARLMLKHKGVDPDKAIFTQTGSVSNTVTSLGQGAVSAAILSGPHNVIMAQKGFRSIGAADELPTHFPTSGLVVNETKLKSDAPRIKNVIRVMLDATAFCRKEKNWVVNYIKDRWKLEPKTAETVYDQWLSILTPDGKISVKDMQEYFDLAYSQKQIPAAINVAAVTDYSLLDQVLAGK
jgi:ABC-type nitrate/sulfonate/bicarbonate transport system substrate-binding protein